MKLINVIQHTSAEYLGLMEDHLEGRGLRFRYFRPFAQPSSLPHIDGMHDGLILLGGGPWGSAGARDLPTLRQEIALAHACLMREWPLLGIGLGAQIVALASGGRVEAGALLFDVTTARRTGPSALNGYLPEEFPLAVYMRDWPAPPAYAEVLARDARGRSAVWQIGRSAFGFAGHPGMKLAIAEDLIMEFEESPPGSGSELEKLRAAQPAIADALVPIMTGLVQVTGWMEARAQ
jgi:GMP synthase-like glutamine amidotransferase